MNSGWFEAVSKALPRLRSRRGALGVLGGLAAWSLLAAGLWNADDAEAKKNKKRHRKKRQKRKRRRRRRNGGCPLLPSGAECSEAAQCCSGTCDANTAFPQFEAVCCRALGEICTIGLNECCQDFMCECPDPPCFNGSPGICG
ncbi:MAG: hypothetical protein ACRDJC_16690 [Thermomicrobiales bacterium]